MKVLNKFKDSVKNSKLKMTLFIAGSALVVLAVILLIFVVNNEQGFMVSFESNGGSKVDAVVLEQNGMIKAPQDPKKEGYKFEGWYLDGKPFDFSKPVTEDMKLEAVWKKIQNVSSIKISEEKLTLNVGDKFKLSFEITPDNSDNKDVEWTSSNSNIVKVDNSGSVKALKQGTATITVTTKDGEYKDAVVITVNPKESAVTQEEGYKVIFVDEDGTKLASTQIIKDGDKATKPKEPTKEGHTFEEWYNKDKKYSFDSKVNKDIKLTAKWSKNKYTVTFKNYDGTVLETKTVEYGVVPNYTGDTPLKAADEKYTYEFTTWSASLKPVKGDITYTALFNRVYVEYEITFVDEDGSVLDKKIYHYGDRVEQSLIPTKQADETYTYTFASWSPAFEIVEKDATYTATYTKEINKYAVSFVDEDGTLLTETQLVELKNKATKPLDPVKQGHTFIGWFNGSEEFNFEQEITANIELTAKWSKNKYTVTFVDEDGSVLETKAVEYGVTPEYTGKAPVKTSTQEFTYTFAGWDKEITPVTGDTTYTVTYKQETRKYTVTFVDEDGSVLEAKTVEYGMLPEYTGNIPVKDNTAEFTYTFAGWDKEVVAVTGDTTYTATYKEEIRTYTVTFVDDNGTVLETKIVEYGVLPEYTGHTPVKESTQEFTYIFAGWDKEFVAVTDDTTYTATYESVKNKYTVIFVNEDGSILETKTVEYGVIPEYTGKAPIKETTQEYTYTFAGWDKEIVGVTGDITYAAIYTAVKNKYTVTFVDENGIVLETKTVEYGILPEYSGITPAKADTQEYTYTFAGWDKEVVAVEKDTTYTATYKEEIRKYTVTFVNEDGSVLETKAVEYGILPEYSGITPVKANTAEFTYTFAGWDKEIVAVTDDTTYTATYTTVKNKYTVIFVNEDGSVLETKTVEYGILPEYSGITPVKANTAEFTYAFASWDKDVVAVTGDTTYTATYAAVKNKYTVTFVDEDGTVLETKAIEYGAIPEYTGKLPVKESTEQYTCKFVGWDKQVIAVTGNVTYTATYENILNKYTVTFVDEDGTVLSELQEVEYGNVATKPADPTKVAYTFVGWYIGEEEYLFSEQIKADIELTAKWIKTKYIISFVDEDGKLLGKDIVEYGDIPNYTGETPVKPADEQYEYTFTGWTPNITTATTDTTYTATYAKNYKEYTIIFENESEVIDTKKAQYGSILTKPLDPVKAGHTFEGWYNGTVKFDFTKPIEKDLTLKAKWSKNKYTVTFVDDNGIVLETKTVEYGTLPEYTGKVPVKENTAEFTYTFIGWDKEVVAADKDITYTATYTAVKNKYTVTFVDETGNVIEKLTVEFGSKVDKLEVAPVIGYTFEGWYNEDVKYDFTKPIEKDLTLKQKFSKNKYSVTFVNEDGSVLETIMIEHGEMPAYTGNTPIKEADAQYEYAFAGWDKEVVAAEKDTTYTATYTSTVRTYTVKFVNEDGTVLEEKNIQYGTLPEYTGKTPVKTNTAEFTFAFAGWDKELVTVEKDTTYTATYTATKNKYTVIFNDDNGKLLQSELHEYGTIPEYKASIPVKTNTAEYTYTFAGWDKEIVPVTELTVYTATYAAVKNKYTVTFVDEDGTVLEEKMLEYGTLPEYTGKTPTKTAINGKEYIFAGWNKEIVSVDKNVTYKATYKESLDIDKEMNDTISKIYANKFAVTRTGTRGIAIEFTSYTTTNSAGITTTTKPPYKFTDIFYEMIDLLDMISSNPMFESVELYHKNLYDDNGMTIDLTDYDLTDTDYESWYGGGPNDRVGEWLGYVATGEPSTTSAFKSDTEDLVGKGARLDITLKDGYVFSDGNTTETFYIIFK